MAAPPTTEELFFEWVSIEGNGGDQAFEDLCSRHPTRADELRQLRPGDALTVALLADAYVTQDQLDEADAILDEAIESRKGRRSPELAAFQHRKSRVAAARGDRRRQLELLQQAYVSDKNNGDVMLELADLAEALEEWDLAIKVLRSITVSDNEGPISRTQALLRQAKIAFKREPSTQAGFQRRPPLFVNQY